MHRNMKQLVAAAVAAGALAVAAGGCGGGQTAAPTTPADQSAGGGGSSEDELIPEEKYEEIKATFARKTGSVSRCHVEGVQSGDVERSEKGHVTVALIVNRDGSASNVRVMETSFKSSKVGDCVVRMVSGWTFTTLPRPLETSHTYVLDRL
jgi:hypothetical protein